MIDSKTLKLSMIRISMRKVATGARCGSVTRRSRSTREAPSTIAASSVSRGTVWSAA